MKLFFFTDELEDLKELLAIEPPGENPATPGSKMMGKDEGMYFLDETKPLMLGDESGRDLTEYIYMFNDKGDLKMKVTDENKDLKEGGVLLMFQTEETDKNGEEKLVYFDILHQKKSTFSSSAG